MFILAYLKDMERTGTDNVQQHDIVEEVLKRIHDSANSVSLDKSVELKKQISCSLYLANKTDNYVAFKVKFIRILLNFEDYLLCNLRFFRLLG